MEAMKIYIQQTTTGQWLSERCVWVPTQREAKSFPSTVDALDFCLANHITGAQVVLCFADSRFNISIPMAPAQ